MMTRSEKINLAATIAGPIILMSFIGWVGWSVKTYLALELAAQDKHNSEAYIARPWFESYQRSTNDKLEKISQDVSTVREHVAGIEGQLSTTVRTK